MKHIQRITATAMEPIGYEDIWNASFCLARAKSIQKRGTDQEWPDECERYMHTK